MLQDKGFQTMWGGKRHLCLIFLDSSACTGTDSNLCLSLWSSQFSLMIFLAWLTLLKYSSFFFLLAATIIMFYQNKGQNPFFTVQWVHFKSTFDFVSCVTNNFKLFSDIPVFGFHLLLPRLDLYCFYWESFHGRTNRCMVKNDNQRNVSASPVKQRKVIYFWRWNALLVKQFVW